MQNGCLGLDSNSDIYSIYRITFSYFLSLVLEYKIVIYMYKLKYDNIIKIANQNSLFIHKYFNK
jgi:hypothetical protein